MSTTTEELSTRVRAITGDLGDAVQQAETLLEFARDARETAAAHGWGGIAATMTEAVDHLEGVVGQLQSAERSGEATSTALDGIEDVTSSSEVAAQLRTALGELDEARSSTEGAVALIDEAVEACQAAGQRSLPESLALLRDISEELNERIGQLYTDVDTERHVAENYAERDVGEATSGNGERAAEKRPRRRPRHPHATLAPRQRRPAGRTRRDANDGWSNASPTSR